MKAYIGVNIIKIIRGSKMDKNEIIWIEAEKLQPSQFYINEDKLVLFRFIQKSGFVGDSIWYIAYKNQEGI